MTMYTRSGRRSSGIDWILVFSYLALVTIGLMMIYTTTYNDYGEDSMWSLRSPVGSQLIFAALSFVLIIFLSVLDWHVWNTLSLPAYTVGILLLILLFFIGTEIKGAKSWISLGPGNLQPSEFAKLATALFAASLLSSVQTKLSQLKSQVLMVGIMSLPAFLIILQPDPGSALTFLSLLIVYYRFGMPQIYYVSMLLLFLTVVFSLTQGFIVVASALFFIGSVFLTNISKKDILPVMLLASLLLVNILCYQFDVMHVALGLNIIYLLSRLFFLHRPQNIISPLSILSGIALLCIISFGSSFAFDHLLKPHQQDRINVWLQPEKCDPRGSLYNLLQSKLAIGSGGLTGKGYLNGTLTKLNYVPEQTTDFIFSSIGEEQGFLGGIGVIVLFTIMVLRLISIGEHSKYSFVRAYCYAVAGFIFCHFFVNIGMTMGISPVIGIPLPFISKGGSSLLSFSIMIGIALNMSKEK